MPPPLKKACGIQLALYLVIATAIGAIVYRRYPVTPAVLISAVVGGFILWIGVAYLYGIPAKIAEARIIRRARAGEPPRDGEKFAAIGRLVTTGPALVSPFTNSPAVAYKYEIQVYGKENVSTMYSGFALNPSSIQGPQGRVRLLAYPELKVKPEYIGTEEARRNAEAYVSTTSFRDPTVGNLRQSLAEMMALYKDDDGTIRHDERHAGAEASDLASARFVEWVVRPGEQVCVIGHYSAQRGGLVCDPENPLDQVKIQTGDPDIFAGRAVRGAIGYLIAGLVIVTGALAGLTAFLANVPLEAAEQMAPEMRVSWPEVRLERFIEQRVRVPMREMGILGTSTVSNELAFGSASGRVRDVFLSRADAEREANRTVIRLDDDAVVLIVDEKKYPVSLRLLGTDIPSEAWPGALEVQITTLSEQEVRGRFTFLPDDQDFPPARAAFAAVVR